MGINDRYYPWQIPDNLFDYVQLVSQSDVIGSIPKEKLGTEIAIVGAGCAGLCAAYELMKIGLHPVVYESAENADGTPRIGGRMNSYRFPGDRKAIAELGAMRFPPTQRTVTYYLDKFGLDYSRKFPDPLVVPTTLFFKGKKHFIPVDGKLPPVIHRALRAWKAIIQPMIDKMIRVWKRPERLIRQWEKFVEEYQHKSFYQVLNENGLSKQEIEYFGLIGLGTGGFNSLFQISFLEILRIVVCRWEVDQRLIKGGADRLPAALWSDTSKCSHWGSMSVSRLNQRRPRPAVKEIFVPTNPAQKVIVTEINGGAQSYDAVLISCSLRALEMDIKINRSAFSDDVWAAIQNIHLINSSKVFVRTRTAFWKHQEPSHTLSCTITDEATRGTYLFDFEDTRSGVICLSYTWADSSIKFNALSHEERVESCIRILGKIYGRDFISDQVVESVSISWEEMKGYNGAFKLTQPGQYAYQQSLYYQPFTPSPRRHNGVYLSGDTTSWAGGWIEGAFRSGLDATMAIVKKLGGKLNTSEMEGRFM
jgi:monoamine oxidase